MEADAVPGSTSLVSVGFLGHLTFCNSDFFQFSSFIKTGFVASAVRVYIFSIIYRTYRTWFQTEIILAW